MSARHAVCPQLLRRSVVVPSSSPPFPTSVKVGRPRGPTERQRLRASRGSIRLNGSQPGSPTGIIGNRSTRRSNISLSSASLVFGLVALAGQTLREAIHGSAERYRGNRLLYPAAKVLAGARGT